MKPRVLITYNIYRDVYKEVLKDFDIIMPAEGIETFKYEDVIPVVDSFDAILSMWNFPIDQQLLDAAKNLKIVSNYAVGYDNIDVVHATRCGVVVANTPDPVTEPTADIAMGLMLSLMRRIVDCDNMLRAKELKWGIMNNLGTSLSGKQLGIIGMGRIGKAVARRALACGMNIVYHNRNRMSAIDEKLYNAKYVSLDELIETSDVVSLNAPLTSETYHIIDANRLAQMKRDAFLINTARGALVDEKALIEALKNGTIKGAGLDVFETGDNVCDELLALPNTVLVPHIGTQTVETRREMAEFAATNILNFFNGGKVAQVNKF
ncbi:MAG: NAD(P)-binding domain-containing protein [Bacteroidaceae bacterium]|nr:NAD(P)-binding domain-containing protein [Bacteroidaceae bacterium]MBQ5705768.1 NAD(P)-binding domain-containing protein [Bacteroidaceae bacterium]MBQ5817181.1 NAD(P)-binding domain-containing protein [Bacteroidaceae bacterium]